MKKSSFRAGLELSFCRFASKAVKNLRFFPAIEMWKTDTEERNAPENAPDEVTAFWTRTPRCAFVERVCSTPQCNAPKKACGFFAELESGALGH
ncbi:MAG: hypothetical protein IKI03_07045 [Clostridia bacterium]|nr:hypothetical protein [Clostridia bacterium]